MNNITNISLKYLNRTSKYIKPVQMEYILNGKRNVIDLINTHDAISALLFNKARGVFVLVKQFRPLIYVNALPRDEQLGHIDLRKYPISNGVTIEACSGIVDKNLPKEQVLVQEISEECGYSVRVENLEKIMTYRTATLNTSASTHFYYCELDDSMRNGSKGIEEGVEVVEMTIDEVRQYLRREDFVAPASLCYGFYWFFKNKLKR